MLSTWCDIPILKQADADSAATTRGLLRVTRRIAQRCWLDQATIQRPRVFCQNCGGCGSTYIVDLLTRNGIPRAYHEKTPDLLEIGLAHYEKPLPSWRLIRLLRYTRHDVFFEANNRLFSLSREIASAFPKALLIHLHRDGVESIRSSLSKPNLPQTLRQNIRYQGTLAGLHTADAFTRMCHHWANMNRRIHEDLRAIQSRLPTAPLPLRFEDLVAGNTAELEQVIGCRLNQKISQPSNVRPTRSAGRFPAYAEWSPSQKQTFDDVCGPVMSLLGR